jgi:hypothetical protein
MFRNRAQAFGALSLAVMVLSACGGNPGALTRLVEARRLASELHVEFTKAADASNRAVMADTDEASAAAADEARRGRQVVETDIDALRPILQSLGYSADLQALEAFNVRFAEYRTLDNEILPLAVENTNLKAQRLAFGPAQEAASAFGAAVDAAARAARGACCAQAAAARARAALLEMQVLQAPHIAESDNAAMTRLETQMAASARQARAALDELKAPAAAGALDRFVALNDEIVRLSRRNSNVRSLALSLGRKRKVNAECEDDLQALEQALDKHAFSATR